MEKLIFDDGLKRIEINDNGVLCFNPSDLNVYQRLSALLRELPDMEKKYLADVKNAEENADNVEQIDQIVEELDRAKAIDAELKKKLAWVFGPANDFDVLLGGVNLMSPANNGERVITNFINAITPYLEEGVKKHARNAAAEAVAAAMSDREKRTAAR